MATILPTTAESQFLTNPENVAVATAYLYDALGTVAGFMLFYLVALQAGTAAPFVIGAVAYAGAWWVLPAQAVRS